jgi:poly-beta-1,6-N-acetyl-D-glucosamine biosynthesis protein PgaD
LGQPRPGDPAILNNTIIRAGAARPLANRIVDGIVTTLLWLGYLYLMRHVFSVVLSYFGVSAPWGLQWSDISVPPLVTNIQTYALIVLANGAVFISWALYNKFMFGYRGRRRSSTPVTRSETSAHFLISEAQIGTCQSAKRIVMVHDANGKLIQYDAS